MHSRRIFRSEVSFRPSSGRAHKCVVGKFDAGKTTLQHTFGPLPLRLEGTIFGPTAGGKKIIFSGADQIVGEVEVNDLLAIQVHANDKYSSRRESCKGGER